MFTIAQKVIKSCCLLARKHMQIYMAHKELDEVSLFRKQGEEREE